MTDSYLEYKKVLHFQMFTEFKPVLKEYKFEPVKEKSIITLIIKDILKLNVSSPVFKDLRHDVDDFFRKTNIERIFWDPYQNGDHSFGLSDYECFQIGIYILMHRKKFKYDDLIYFPENELVLHLVSCIPDLGIDYFFIDSKTQVAKQMVVNKQERMCLRFLVSQVIYRMHPKNKKITKIYIKKIKKPSCIHIGDERPYQKTIKSNKSFSAKRTQMNYQIDSRFQAPIDIHKYMETYICSKCMIYKSD